MIVNCKELIEECLRSFDCIGFQKPEQQKQFLHIKDRLEALTRGDCVCDVNSIGLWMRKGAFQRALKKLRGGVDV